MKQRFPSRQWCCVLLNAKRDENWKMTVVYGIGMAGAVALMKAMFGGAASSAVTGFQAGNEI